MLVIHCVDVKVRKMTGKSETKEGEDKMDR